MGKKILIMSRHFGEGPEKVLPKKQRLKDFAADYHDIGTYLIAQPDFIIHYIGYSIFAIIYIGF